MTHGPRPRAAILGLLLLAAGAVGGARADEADTSRPANALFGAVRAPAGGSTPEVVGGYARGCIQGAVQLPTDGPGWQVMRLSRNRNWGHPALVGFIQHLAADARRDGWPGLLVGDMGQPRGGPMRSGHASHQDGLDVDIWLTPMPDRTLSAEERESLGAVSMVSGGRYAIDSSRFGKRQAALIRRAALFPEVERIFVNPGIKKALCATPDEDRDWLRKVRPWYGHDDHLHVRLRCPQGQLLCKEQDPVPPGDGCGADLAWWFDQPLEQPKAPAPPPKPLTLADLPPACRGVLEAP